MSWKKIWNLSFLFFNSCVIHVNDFRSIQVGKNVNFSLTSLIVIEINTITAFAFERLNVEVLATSARETVGQIAVLSLLLAGVNNRLTVVINCVNQWLLVLRNRYSGRCKKPVKFLRNDDLLPWFTRMNALDINLIIVTGNALLLIDIKNVKRFHALYTGDSIKIWERRVAIDQIWVREFIWGNVSLGIWVGLLFIFGNDKSFHVVVIRCPVWFLDASQLVNVEIVAWYTGCPIIKRTWIWTAIMIVFRCFVLFKDLYSIFQNFG